MTLDRITQEVLRAISKDPGNAYLPSDSESLVKHTLKKLGYPPSLVGDHDRRFISEKVEEILMRHRKKSASIHRESWYWEAGT